VEDDFDIRNVPANALMEERVVVLNRLAQRNIRLPIFCTACVGIDEPEFLR
jgi:hypothetical protein